MFGRPTKTKPEKQLCSETACPAHNQSNLQALVRWTIDNMPHAPLAGWELGNELNSCLNGEAGARTQVSPRAVGPISPPP